MSGRSNCRMCVDLIDWNWQMCRALLGRQREDHVKGALDAPEAEEEKERV